MSKPKLTYFNFTGIAESTRFLFAYGDVDYDDVRMDHANWPAIKSNFPFGQLPLLEIDGHIINQHKAIARYAAKLVKLTGNNEVEDAIIDAAVDSIYDFKLKTFEFFYETDAATIALKKEKTKTEIVPHYVKNFETLLDANNGYFALGRLTWADIYFASWNEYFEVFTKDFLPSSEKLSALNDKVREIPNIKAWIAKRPPSNYVTTDITAK